MGYFVVLGMTLLIFGLWMFNISPWLLFVVFVIVLFAYANFKR